MKIHTLGTYTLAALISLCLMAGGCDNGSETDDIQSDSVSLGDYYYSDGTYSTVYNPQKEVIGIVYAISSDKGGQILHGTTKGYHGRIVALRNISTDNNELLYWGEYGGDQEIPDLTRHATMDGQRYYSFIDTTNPSGWQSGALSDWNGAENTKNILKYCGEKTVVSNIPADYPAASYCNLYGKPEWKTGKPGEWYLPACGEAALLYARRELLISKLKECGGQWFGSYLWTSTAFDWKANEGKHTITQNLSGSSWVIYFTYGMVAWPTRDCPKPVRPVMSF